MPTKRLRRSQAPSLSNFKGLVRILEEDDNGVERCVRTEQVTRGNYVYHPTKGWRKSQSGFSPKGHSKIMNLINRKVG